MTADLPLQVGEEFRDRDPHPYGVLFVRDEGLEKRFAGVRFRVAPERGHRRDPHRVVAARETARHRAGDFLRLQAGEEVEDLDRLGPPDGHRIAVLQHFEEERGQLAGRQQLRERVHRPGDLVVALQVALHGFRSAVPQLDQEIADPAFFLVVLFQVPGGDGEAPGELVDRFGRSDAHQPLGGVHPRLRLRVPLGERLGGSPDAGSLPSLPGEQFEDHGAASASPMRWRGTFWMP